MKRLAMVLLVSCLLGHSGGCASTAPCGRADTLETCRARSAELRSLAGQGGLASWDARLAAAASDDRACSLGDLPSCRRYYAYTLAVASGRIGRSYRDARTLRVVALREGDTDYETPEAAERRAGAAWTRLLDTALSAARADAGARSDPTPFLDFRREFPDSGEEEPPFRDLALTALQRGIPSAYLEAYGPECAHCAEVRSRLERLDFEALGLERLSEGERFAALRVFHARFPDGLLDEAAAFELASTSSDPAVLRWYGASFRCDAGDSCAVPREHTAVIGERLAELVLAPAARSLRDSCSVESLDHAATLVAEHAGTAVARAAGEAVVACAETLSDVVRLEQLARLFGESAAGTRARTSSLRLRADSAIGSPCEDASGRVGAALLGFLRNHPSATSERPRVLAAYLACLTGAVTTLGESVCDSADAFANGPLMSRFEALCARGRHLSEAARQSELRQMYCTPSCRTQAIASCCRAEAHSADCRGSRALRSGCEERADERCHCR